MRSRAIRARKWHWRGRWARSRLFRSQHGSRRTASPTSTSNDSHTTQRTSDMGTTTEQVTKQSQPSASPPREPVVAPPAKGAMRKRIIFGVIAIAAVIALTWAVRKFIYSRGHETTDNAQVDGHIVPVLAKVGGYVTAVLVQDNDSVQKGQTLVRIDDAEYRVKVAQAEADLAAAP